MISNSFRKQQNSRSNDTLYNTTESLPNDSTSIRKEKGEIKTLVYMRNGGQWLEVKLKFCLWQRAVSEHV